MLVCKRACDFVAAKPAPMRRKHEDFRLLAVGVRQPWQLSVLQSCEAGFVRLQVYKYLAGAFAWMSRGYLPGLFLTRCSLADRDKSRVRDSDRRVEAKAVFRVVRYSASLCIVREYRRLLCLHIAVRFAQACIGGRRTLPGARRPRLLPRTAYPFADGATRDHQIPKRDCLVTSVMGVLKSAILLPRSFET